MPNPDDLTFILSAVCDWDSISRALDEAEKQIKERAPKLDLMAAGMSAAGQRAAGKGAAWENIGTWSQTVASEAARGMSFYNNTLENILSATEEAVARQVGALKEVNAELDRERYTLEKLQIMQDPTVLRERVRLEKEVSEARQKVEFAAAQEQRRQEGGLWGMVMKRLLAGGRETQALLGGVIGGRAGPVLGTVAGAVGEEAGAGIGGALGGAAGAALGGPVGAALGAAATEAIGKLTSAFKEGMALASPSLVRQWNIVWEDMKAVLGRTLLPFLELFTQAFRLLGDVLATVLPSTNEVREAIQPLFEAFGELRDAIRAVVAELGPMIREVLIGSLRSLAQVMAGVAQQVAVLLRVFNALGGSTLLRGFMGPFGLLGGTGEQGMRGSGGAAVKEARFQGIEEYGKDIYRAAYALPGAASVPQQQLDQQKQMTNWLEKIYNALSGGRQKGEQPDPARDTVAGVMGAAKLALKFAMNPWGGGVLP